jgi:Domain of unknown function (DUF397)
MDLTGATWRKASYSGNGGNSCVEVAVFPGATEGGARVVAVRDSKNPDAAHLTFTAAEWDAFTDGVRQGEFDLT